MVAIVWVPRVFSFINVSVSRVSQMMAMMMLMVETAGAGPL